MSNQAGRTTTPFETPCHCGAGKDVPWSDHDWSCPWFITEGKTPTSGRGTTHFYADREAQKIHDRSCESCSSGRSTTPDCRACEQGEHAISTNSRDRRCPCCKTPPAREASDG